MSLDQNAAVHVANFLELNLKNTTKVLQLIFEEQCTIPFISRYRKEATGGMDEVQVGQIQEQYNDYLEREKRRSFILETIKSQDKMTKDLEEKILNAQTMVQLEDLYAPYKSKRKTKGQIAIEAGLQDLAEKIKAGQIPFEKVENELAKEFVSSDKGINSIQEAMEGAQAIISEEIVHDPDLRDVLRKDFWRDATLKSEKKKDAEKITEHMKFKDYFEFEQKISELRAAKAAHRYLAMRRGMLLKILKVSVQYNEESALKTIEKKSFDLGQHPCSEFLKECARKAYKVSISTAMDTEIKSELKLLADESAIDVFGINLKNLLLQPYLGQKAVLGIDPGVRTGCKLAVIDKNGKFLVDTVIYPHEPQKDLKGAKSAIEQCIQSLDIKHIAIGNGTFGRETLQFCKEHIGQVKSGKVKAMLVNEDGASIYSASEVARKEFPEKDLTVRGAISIARRFQDPLGELVKIDPKSIGVGQYQHDVNQTKLKKSLNMVVENCVNYVGVDLNTASAPLLSYVSGIGPTVAENIVKQRSKLGGFKTREELLKVGRFSEKVFEQSAGFLRIYDSKNPLDATFIHPERYAILNSWCKENSHELKELIGNKEGVKKLKSDPKFVNQVGEFTAEDIAKSLLAPSQDPRTEFVSFEFRDDATDIKNIKEGQYYPGIVTNLTQFGAFVDIGIKENGLIHVSQIADKFVENALDHLKVGQEVKARVIEVDLNRKRIALSLKSEGGVKQRTPQNQTKTSVNGQKPRNEPVRKNIRNKAFAGLKDFPFKK